MIRKVLELAKYGEGFTSPNPLVGAMVEKKGRIIGIGFHRRAGELHAERVALNMAGDMAKGATLYVNLEPCSHQGRTPPCTDAIIRSKILRCVIGIKDSNPLINGKGIKILKKAGISVDMGILEEECRDINRKHLIFYENKRPFVALKMAISLDGNLATHKGESKWITDKSARTFAHKLRGEFDAIVIGANTLRKDDPELKPRLFYAPQNPVPFIFSRTGRINGNHRLFKAHQRVIMVCPNPVNPPDLPSLEIWTSSSLRNFLKRAKEEGFQNILVEGGGQLFSYFLKEKVVDEVNLFIAPFVVGKGIQAFSRFQLHRLKDKENMLLKEKMEFGDTLYLRYSLR